MQPEAGAGGWLREEQARRYLSWPAGRAAPAQGLAPTPCKACYADIAAWLGGHTRLPGFTLRGPSYSCEDILSVHGLWRHPLTSPLQAYAVG